MKSDLRRANANRQISQPEKPPAFGIELAAQEFADLCLVAVHMNTSYNEALRRLIKEAKGALSKPIAFNWMKP
jgi:hypothetical protein